MSGAGPNHNPLVRDKVIIQESRVGVSLVEQDIIEYVSWTIEMINNMARHNLIDAKYQQMAFRSVPTTLLFEIWSNKSDANLEDSDCTVRMLLFVSIITPHFPLFVILRQNHCFFHSKLKFFIVWNNKFLSEVAI